MKITILTMLLVLAGTLSISAQSAKMTSVYTTFKTDCKPETKVVADEVPFICKAVGGFRARIVPAGAWAETVEIVDAKGETVTSLGTHGYGFTTEPTRKLEWRLANGKPFAVILRRFEYDAEKASENGDNPYLLKYKTGEVLMVRGLSGYGQIEFDVNAREKNANAKAQNMADSNFQ